MVLSAVWAHLCLYRNLDQPRSYCRPPWDERAWNACSYRIVQKESSAVGGWGEGGSSWWLVRSVHVVYFGTFQKDLHEVLRGRLRMLYRESSCFPQWRSGNFMPLLSHTNVHAVCGRHWGTILERVWLAAWMSTNITRRSNSETGKFLPVVQFQGTLFLLLCIISSYTREASQIWLCAFR